MDLSFDDTVRVVRNRLRRYSFESIAMTAIWILNRRYATVDQEMRTFPWLTLTLVEMALQDRMVASVGKTIDEKELLSLVKELWDSTGDRNVIPSGNYYRASRSWGYVQFEFQRVDSLEFLRWPKIIDDLPADHPARGLFENAIGSVPTKDFIDISFAIYSAVINKKIPFSGDHFAEMRHAYGRNVDKILGILSRDVRGLREYFSPSREIGDKSNPRFRMTRLTEVPLLRLPGLGYAPWHNKVFSRGIDEFVHFQLSRSEKSYPEAYSEVFENHVVKVASQTKLEALTEKKFWKNFGRDKHAVEVILKSGRSNVLVEAKFGLYQDDYMTFDNYDYAKHRFRKLHDGVTKALDVSNRLSSVSSDDFWSNREQDFLLLVTNRRLYVPTGRQLEMVMSESPSEIDERVKLPVNGKMPLENIFILPIDSFDKLVEAVSRGELDLESVLKAAASKVLLGPRKIWHDFLEMLESTATPQGITPETSRLYATSEAAMTRLSGVIQG